MGYSQEKVALPCSLPDSPLADDSLHHFAHRGLLVLVGNRVHPWDQCLALRLPRRSVHTNSLRDCLSLSLAVREWPTSGRDQATALPVVLSVRFHCSLDHIWVHVYVQWRDKVVQRACQSWLQNLRRHQRKGSPHHSYCAHRSGLFYLSLAFVPLLLRLHHVLCLHILDANGQPDLEDLERPRNGCQNQAKNRSAESKEASVRARSPGAAESNAVS